MKPQLKFRPTGRPYGVVGRKWASLAMGRGIAKGWLWVLVASCVFLAADNGRAKTPGVSFTLACSKDNDLYVTLRRNGLTADRYDTPSKAIAAARPNSAVLLLADNYPSNTLSLSGDIFQAAAKKGLHLYVEFPSFVPGVTLARPRKTTWERFVVNSDELGVGLAKGRIFLEHECYVQPTESQESLVVCARVAGYSNAVYGIPNSALPVLFVIENGRTLVATTKLSGFIRGRYAPIHEWQALWKCILQRLSGEDIPDLKWRPLVETQSGPDDKLPKDVEAKTFDAAARWFLNSQLLVTKQRQPALQSLLKSDIELTSAPGSHPARGDGRLGVLEGYSSDIRPDGSQPQRTPIRADCQAETAMVLSLDSALNGISTSKKTAANLLDFLYFNSDLCSGPRRDPNHPAFGLIGWGSTSRAWMVANYGDDNARAMLATMLAAAELHSDRWDEPLLRALLANLRTTGRLGFRGDRIDLEPLEKNGWRHYHDSDTVNYSPHFEAYNWACFLWAFQHTGEKEFLDKTKIAIGMMMHAYPEKWRWNDNSERARMLLCLAWLVRVEDTPEHRHWLQTVADDLINIQDKTGAIPERFRGTVGSHYQIPQSNEAYGTGEAPLLQQNGDPVSDQLYVTGFTLLALHETAGVWNDPRVLAAENKLAEYLGRIQIRSQAIPYLNGTWFRAFDFRRWEPWASSGDFGWGAWSVESGWGQAWTAAALGLRRQKTTLWEATTHTRIAEKLGRVRQQMAENQGQPFKP